MTEISSAPLAKIITKSGFEYQLTDDDLLTLARSIRKESPADRSEIAWTYAQRYALLKSGGSSAYPTLASMVKAHSQPINPAWFPDGRYCAPGSQYHDDASMCGQHAVNRISNASYPWERIDLGLRAYLLSWASAREPNTAPRSVDFRARDAEYERIASGQSGRDLVYLPLGTRNSFYATARSSAWPRNFVELQLGRRTIGEREPAWWAYGLVVGTVVGIFAGTAGYLGKGPGRP